MSGYPAFGEDLTGDYDAMDTNPYSAPESVDLPASEAPVTVEISQKWVRRVNSPMFIVVSALTGVSVTFMPMALLALGIHNHWHFLTIAAAVLCGIIIYFVPMFYMLLAGQVIRQLHRKSPTSILRKRTGT